MIPVVLAAAYRPVHGGRPGPVPLPEGRIAEFSEIAHWMRVGHLSGSPFPGSGRNTHRRHR